MEREADLLSKCYLYKKFKYLMFLMDHLKYQNSLLIFLIKINDFIKFAKQSKNKQCYRSLY
jgi:hypothetical protein